MRERISPHGNVRLTVFDKDTGRIVDIRQSHNVLTNIGRSWLRSLVGFANGSVIDVANGYIEGAGNVHTSERIGFMGFGVGGAKASSPYFRTQEELVTVTSLEDWVRYDSSNYLVQVNNQSTEAGSFPDAYTIRFVANVPESAISYSGNQSKSAASVGTVVPITEAGLYLSGADKSQNPDHADNVTRLVCYNIFDKITITPNVTFRAEWDLLF
jgi:hypothetical protein